MWQVFIDPPWGGPDYSNLEKFTLSHFAPNGKEVLDVAFKNFEKVVLRIPKNFDEQELVQFGKEYVVDTEAFDDRVIFRVVYFFKPIEL